MICPTAFAASYQPFFFTATVVTNPYKPFHPSSSHFVPCLLLVIIFTAAEVIFPIAPPVAPCAQIYSTATAGIFSLLLQSCPQGKAVPLTISENVLWGGEGGMVKFIKIFSTFSPNYSVSWQLSIIDKRFWGFLLGAQAELQVWASFGDSKTILFIII